MQKFILVVPSNDNEKFFINKKYINNIKSYNIPYYICDYNVQNIDYNYIGGVLLTGGGDIEPSLYNQHKHQKTQDICLKRDIFEITLLKEAFKRKIPTFAICRGVQIMNVAFGGTINQHIEKHLQKEDKKIATHYVKVDKKSTLYKILDKSKINVNSVHHQVIDKVANGFSVCATCDNIIEGIEYVKNGVFFMGVQWHPEALNDDNSKKLFTYFKKMIADK